MEIKKQYWKPGNMLYPVPAVLVTCQRPGEKPNIITIAWTGTICSDPAMVYISVRPGRYSYPIIRDTGEFVINLTTKDLASAADYCGVKSGRDVDKFEKMQLTPGPSKTVETPCIAESPVNIECKVTQRIPLGTHDMFLANVTAVGVDERYMDEKGKFHFEDAHPIAWSHGEYYALEDCVGRFGYTVRKKK